MLILWGVWTSGLTSCLATCKSFVSCMHLICMGRWEGKCKYLHEPSFGNVAKGASCVKCRNFFTCPLKHGFPTKGELREFNATAHIFATKPFTFWLHQSNLVIFFFLAEMDVFHDSSVLFFTFLTSGSVTCSAYSCVAEWQSLWKPEYLIS